MFALLAGAALAQAPLAAQSLGADHPFVSDLPIHGELRLRADHLGIPVVDDLGTPSERRAWGTSRLRVGAEYSRGLLGGELELEAFSARWGGGTPLGTDYAPDVFAIDRTGGGSELAVVMPRQAWLSVGGRRGLARVGAQTFTWGTGMLANDGAGDPVFGDAVRGSVVARALGVLTPWRGTPERGALQGLSFLTAFDAVLRDDNADLFRGDLALQGVVGVRTDGPRWQGGLLGVGRFQRDRLDPYHPLEQPHTWAFPVDGHLRVQLSDPEAPQTVGLEGEVVGLLGSTERTWTDETVREGARIRGGGFVARVRYDHAELRLTGLLEGGGASGDNDGRDAVVRSFSMHSDHNVGLILFEELLPLLTARAVDRAADPALTGVPSPSGRFAVNQGQVTNALYLYPTIRWRFVEAAEARLGVMTARTAGDLVDVYQSALSGGYNTTPGGRTPGRRGLGSEVLLGTRTTLPVGITRLDLGAEGALFLPGPALDGLALGPLATVRGRLDYRW